ncbi:MAG: AbrB/MazE/SpoVT family DNA-binding domain-containing protein [Deltaproteobacteria bacterium]|nr:AbrB/MazE/SpoVT family DNA-binding domain-containing protein [Deltaproteobacteria bacterium]
MLAKRTYKNQITIPKEVIDKVGDTHYFDVSYQDGAICLRPVEIKNSHEHLKTIRQKIKSLGLREEEIPKIIRQVRSKAFS